MRPRSRRHRRERPSGGTSCAARSTPCGDARSRLPPPSPRGPPPPSLRPRRRRPDVPSSSAGHGPRPRRARAPRHPWLTRRHRRSPRHRRRRPAAQARGLDRETRTRSPPCQTSRSRPILRPRAWPPRRSRLPRPALRRSPCATRSRRRPRHRPDRAPGARHHRSRRPALRLTRRDQRGTSCAAPRRPCADPSIGTRRPSQPPRPWARGGPGWRRRAAFRVLPPSASLDARSPRRSTRRRCRCRTS